MVHHEVFPAQEDEQPAMTEPLTFSRQGARPFAQTLNALVF
jgi:hypothetical protein